MLTLFLVFSSVHRPREFEETNFLCGLVKRHPIGTLIEESFNVCVIGGGPSPFPEKSDLGLVCRHVPSNMCEYARL